MCFILFHFLLSIRLKRANFYSWRGPWSTERRNAFTQAMRSSAPDLSSWVSCPVDIGCWRPDRSQRMWCSGLPAVPKCSFSVTCVKLNLSLEVEGECERSPARGSIPELSPGGSEVSRAEVWESVRRCSKKPLPELLPTGVAPFCGALSGGQETASQVTKVPQWETHWPQATVLGEGREKVVF